LKDAEETGAWPAWRQWFLGLSKRDDVADAFLQAAFHLITKYGAKLPKPNARKKRVGVAKTTSFKAKKKATPTTRKRARITKVKE
jgi:hypothetical protein